MFAMRTWNVVGGDMVAGTVVRLDLNKEDGCGFDGLR
jgi:hypothetical protein